MDAYEKRFLKLLTYLYYIKYEKIKIQIFMSGLPIFCRDKIQYDMPKTLKEVIGKEKHLYKFNKNKKHKNLNEGDFMKMGSYLWPNMVMENGNFTNVLN